MYLPLKVSLIAVLFGDSGGIAMPNGAIWQKKVIFLTKPSGIRILAIDCEFGRIVARDE
jgi:hypothetical protein